MDNFENILSKLRADCETKILGDFNICFLKQAGCLQKKCLNILRMFNLQQLISEPTRVTYSSKSLLDHILCNNKEIICQSGTISLGLSDHFMTFCTRKISKNQLNRHNTVRIRSLKRYYKEEFLNRLANANWENCFLLNTVNEAWSSFKDIFMEILNSVAPVKEVCLKQRTEPWIAQEILEYIKERDHFLYLFKKHGNKEDYIHFCKMRNQVQKEIRIAKSSFFLKQNRRK